MYSQYRGTAGTDSMGASPSKPPAPTGQTKEQINAELDAMRAKMVKVFEDQNPEGFPEFYTEDVHQVIPGVGIVIGRDEVVNRARKEMHQVETMTSAVVGREITDTLVSELTTFKLKLKGMDQEIAGKAMITYVRDPKDGKWKIKFDMDVPDGM